MAYNIEHGGETEAVRDVFNPEEVIAFGLVIGDRPVVLKIRNFI